MNTFLRILRLSALVLLCAGLRLAAQELSLLGGLLPKSNLSRSSFTWQVDYRQDLYRNLAASIAYINEGHVPGHHRDGTAWQAWGRLPFFEDRFTVSLGAGAYYFFDTQQLPGGDTANIHGVAPIYSVSGTGYLSNRWYYRVNYNRISPSKQLNVNTLTAGLGFWFGEDRKPTPGRLGDAPNERGYVTESELTLFGGQSIVNTFLSQKAVAYAAEYRRGVFPHIDWTLSAIHEGDPKIIRRNGAATQLWFVNTFFNDRIALGGGLGPYVFIDRNHPAPATQKNPATIAPLASLTFSVRLSDHWIMRMVFDRVASNYNRDADIFLLGLGYRWPR